MINILQKLYELVFPNICLGCGDTLSLKNTFVCYYCNLSLPYTNFQHQKDNFVFQTLQAHSSIPNACSIFFFQNESALRNLIHYLKYKNKPNVGIWLGEKMGTALSENPSYLTIDYIMPIPLHPKKQILRGYNQSAQLAKGVANVLQKPMIENYLHRIKNTQKQASLKTAQERKQNLADAFELTPTFQNISNSHILLIDDVFTTGSTIKSCLQPFATYTKTKVSVCTLAMTFN